MGLRIVDALPQIDRRVRHSAKYTRRNAYRHAAPAFAIPPPLAEQVSVLAKARDTDVAADVRAQPILDEVEQLALVARPRPVQEILQQLAKGGDADLELARIVEISDLRHPQRVARQD